MTRPVTDWLIFIGGFMQDRSLAAQGMCGMAHECRDRYSHRGVLVDYEPWKQNWKSTAEWIFRWSGYDAGTPDSQSFPPNIMVVAYSWGAGWGLVQLAEHLSYRELTIDVAVACDAVRHVGWQWSHAIGLSQACAYMPWWTIEKPANIRSFHWFRQKRRRHLLTDWKNGTTWLYGHKWTEVRHGRLQEAQNGERIDGYSHTNMDDAREFKQKVYSLADNLFLQRAM